MTFQQNISCTLHNSIQKSIKIFCTSIHIPFFSCFVYSDRMHIYQLSTSVLNLNKVDQFPNFAKFQKRALLFLFLCQKLLYDSGSLGYSMAFGVIIISIINITLAIKFPDVASLYFNSYDQLLSWKMVKIDMSSQAVVSADT